MIEPSDCCKLKRHTREFDEGLVKVKSLRVKYVSELLSCIYFLCGLLHNILHPSVLVIRLGVPKTPKKTY